MENSSNIVTLMTDPQRYESTFSEYCRRMNRYEVMKDWINRFIPEHITNVLDVEPADELRILGVGTGPGHDETFVLKQLLKKFPKIKHTVIEPNHKHIRHHKDLTTELKQDFSGVSFEWHQQTLDKFRQNTSKEQLKYHVIMAFHVLYYVEDHEEVLKYLISMLEDGGKLLTIVEGDDSCMTNVIGKFRQLQDPYYTPISTRHVEQTLTSINMPFTTNRIACNIDATCCFEDTSADENLLIDFVTHVPYLKKLVSAPLYDSIIEYFKSDKVSLPKRNGGKHWFKCYYDAILVTM